MSQNHNQENRRAIIDIGSNSIRLVVFGGAMRAPVILYNEKLAAELGRAVIATGMLDPVAMQRALASLARFQKLTELMHVDSLRVVATAAVRDASNGAIFLEQIKALGLPVDLLSGQEEAEASANGVLSEFPDADGLVADLGGGSLELVRIKAGKIKESISLPFGILRVADIRSAGKGALKKHLEKLLSNQNWLHKIIDKPLYAVGGSWRALAHVHIEMINFPLAMIGNHIIPANDALRLQDYIAEKSPEDLKAIQSLPQSRIAMLSDSAALLNALMTAIQPSKIITCSSGLREGLLHLGLSNPIKLQDPLIAGAKEMALRHSRFSGYDDALAAWLAELFGDETARLNRLRHASCMLADMGWTNTPEFRAMSGEELALHGNWTGVLAEDRAIIAMALFSSFGGKGSAVPNLLAKLATTDDLMKARYWGLAIRLAHRLSGGAADALLHTKIKYNQNNVILSIPKNLSMLDNGSVRRRLGRLADAMGLQSSVIE